jgi:mannan endo-1,4-beta-mannosidase
MKYIKYILIASAAVFLAACSSSDDETEYLGTAPKLVSSSPTNGSKDNTTGEKTITVTFDQNINFLSANASKITIDNDAIIESVILKAVSGKYNTLTIVAKDLVYDSNYTITIPAGTVKGTGTTYNDDVTVSFATKTAKLSTRPCDSLATDNCKKLYTYLLSVYGKKCLSSTMANINWNHTEADHVHSLTGKYPAINCYDFLHIYASPSNWINYSDLTPVTEWANAGGIVSLMWHFNVPTAKGSSDYTVTPSKTTFKCSNVFTSGTWENKYFYEQMDKVVTVLLQLQDAGIAALWRPFHEGAGNYYAKNYSGTAWFWWGEDGPDSYIKLWKTMYSYFIKKGIHNLIWIWTAQDYNGDSANYNLDNAYYPGDAYVDIVGRDLYGEGTDATVSEWNTVKKFYAQKMLTLSECGNTYDDAKGTVTSAQSTISAQWGKGCNWLYFMPWYDPYYDNGTRTTNLMCSDSFWTDAMSQSYVITRDQVSY